MKTEINGCARTFYAFSVAIVLFMHPLWFFSYVIVVIYESTKTNVVGVLAFSEFTVSKMSNFCTFSLFFQTGKYMFKVNMKHKA